MGDKASNLASTFSPFLCLVSLWQFDDDSYCLYSRFPQPVTITVAVRKHTHWNDKENWQKATTPTGATYYAKVFTNADRL